MNVFFFGSGGKGNVGELFLEVLRVTVLGGCLFDVGCAVESMARAGGFQKTCVLGEEWGEVQLQVLPCF